MKDYDPMTAELTRAGTDNFTNSTIDSDFVYVDPKELYKHHIEEALTKQRQEFIKLVEKVQKQCSEADGIIDGITALHSLLKEIKGDE